MKNRIKHIIVEKRASEDPVTLRVLESLPGVPVEFVEDGADYIRSGASPRSSLILMHHPGGFVKDFPVTPGSPSCGEKYILTGVNCPFDCTYCYLQSYLDHRQLAVFTNTERMKEEIFRSIEGGARRFTTGETTDSLALDRFTGMTALLLPVFAGTDAVLEVRTKSSSIDHLIPSGSGDGPERPGEDRRRPETGSNLMITWTLSPDGAVRSEELFTSPLDDRLAAMAGISSAGIRTAVRFDPVIPYYADGEGYAGLVERIADAVGAAPPVRFELGVLRFPPGLWEVVRERRGLSPLFRGEYITDGEGKIRLYRPERIRLYRRLLSLIRGRFPDVPVELSMESLAVWESVGLEPPVSS